MPNYADDTVSCASVDFFEKLLSAHSKVGGFEKLGHREYQVRRTYGDTIDVWLTGKYVFGSADYYDLHREHNNVGCIVLSSAWNKYTEETKELAANEQIGLFTMTELAGALNIRKFWKYRAKEK